jgi:uncharacterized membrane protein
MRSDFTSKQKTMIRWKLLFLFFISLALVYLFGTKSKQKEWKAHIRYFVQCVVSALILYWIIFIIGPLLFAG